MSSFDVEGGGGLLQRPQQRRKEQRDFQVGWYLVCHMTSVTVYVAEGSQQGHVTLDFAGG